MNNSFVIRLECLIAKRVSRKVIPLLPFALMPLSMVVYASYNLAFSDSFNLVDTFVIATRKMNFVDAFNLFDRINIPSFLQLLDSFRLLDSLNSQLITNIVYTTLTSIVTIVGQGTCTGSCFVNTGTLLSTTVTEILIPACFLIITGFGVFYMGVKSFGIFVMMESFVFLGLAWLGVIPTWWSLLVIIFVSAALTRVVINFFSGGQQ